MLFSPKLHEACGLFGIFAPDKEVAKITYFGLFSLQHRGQESSGMAVSNGSKINIYKKMGLVSQVFNEEIMSKLTGNIAIGHNRYGTTGSSTIANAQPILLETNLGPLAVAHNGNLANTNQLKRKLFSKGHSFYSTTDTEIIAKLIARAKGRNWESKILNGISGLKGAYSLLFLTKNKLFGLRDPLGVRPLALGKFNSGYVLASETAALSNIGAKLIKELEPGEVLVISADGFKTIAKIKSDITAFCIFEYIYFSRPDTILNKQLVYRARLVAGNILAKEQSAQADYVIAVPDSGTSAAIGFSAQSGIPFIEGLLKSRYMGRTFIQPEQKIRNLGVRIKFSPIEGIIKGKKLVVVDDSIVRGTTIAGIIRILKKAGVREVHLRIASPPLISRCYLGVDIRRYDELIAHKRSLDAIRNKVGADSLGYLSLKGLKKAIGPIEYGFCSGCLTGEYPINYEP